MSRGLKQIEGISTSTLTTTPSKHVASTSPYKGAPPPPHTSSVPLLHMACITVYVPKPWRLPGHCMRAALQANIPAVLVRYSLNRFARPISNSESSGNSASIFRVMTWQPRLCWGSVIFFWNHCVCCTPAAAASGAACCCWAASKRHRSTADGGGGDTENTSHNKGIAILFVGMRLLEGWARMHGRNAVRSTPPCNSSSCCRTDKHLLTRRCRCCHCRYSIVYTVVVLDTGRRSRNSESLSSTKQQYCCAARP